MSDDGWWWLAEKTWRLCPPRSPGMDVHVVSIEQDRRDMAMAVTIILKAVSRRQKNTTVQGVGSVEEEEEEEEEGEKVD